MWTIPASCTAIVKTSAPAAVLAKVKALCGEVEGGDCPRRMLGLFRSTVWLVQLRCFRVQVGCLRVQVGCILFWSVMVCSPRRRASRTFFDERCWMNLGFMAGAVVLSGQKFQYFASCSLQLKRYQLIRASVSECEIIFPASRFCKMKYTSQ